MKWGLSLFLLFSLFASSGFSEIVDEQTGQSFPSQVTFSFNGKDYTLDATGVATRKKFMFKVYSVASYLETGEAEGEKFQKVMSPKLAKELRMIWVRNVDAARVQQGFKESLVKAGAPSAETAQFLRFFEGNVSKGDEISLRYIPGGTVEILMNGSSKGTIENEGFAKALWMVWFGPNSVVPREDLVSKM